MAYKQFLPAQVLTASETQTYLMNQSVMVFATSAARTSALTAPSEGMTVYLQDSNSFQFYDGSAWVNLGNVMRFASSAVRATILTSPVEGMVCYLQDTDELQVYNGSSWLTVVVTSDDEGFTTTGAVTAANGGADGGITLRQWTANPALVSLATRDMTSAEYMVLSDGANTYISGGIGGTVNVRGVNNDTTHALQINSTNANFAGTVSIGSDGVVASNTSSQLHVRKDVAGGKGGEISIVNYSNSANSHAALNFGVDASSYGSDTGNAQIRATNTNGTNMATELGFYTWNGSGWGRRLYIDGAARLRYGIAPTSLSNADQAVGTMTVIPGGAYSPSLGGFSTINVWTTVLSGQIDCTSAGVNARFIHANFSMSLYANAGGSFLMRILFQPTFGGSYVSAQQSCFRNVTFDHFAAIHHATVEANYGYGNWFAQVYGNGVTISTDGNDYATCFFYTR